MRPTFTNGDDESDPAAWTSAGRMHREPLAVWSSGRHRAQDAAVRLRADADLYEYLRHQKFQGPDWDHFAHELLAYGMTRVRALVKKRSGRYRHASRCSPGDLEELVNDVVFAGFELFFRKGMVGGNWSPTGGAPLVAYFENACKLVLPEQYRTWLKRYERHANEDPHAQVDAIDTNSNDRGGDQSELLLRLEGVLTERQVQIFQLISDGYSYAEIGRWLGMSEKAVEGQVHRARRKAAQYKPKGWKTR